jgi:acetyl esterase
MPLDPQAELVIGLVKQSGAPEFWQLTPEQAREQYQLRVAKLATREPVFRAFDRRIPGAGSDLTVRVYQPREAKPGERLPVLLWFHGGGFVIGNLDTHDHACRALASQADCLVVAVDYRLAPEFRFPAAVDDCMAALRWMALNATQIGGDPRRIALGGDSAGGNLAAVCAILARNEGHPGVAFQLLIYPCTAPEPETASHRKFAEGYLLTRNNITWFYRQYVRSAKEFYDFRFAPLVTEDLSNLPPALVLVAGYDPLRDEGVEYAKRLIESGNRVTLVSYEGMVHGFLLMGGAVDAAQHALTQSSAAVKQAFSETE